MQFWTVPLITILEDNCLDVNLTNEQRLEIKIHFLKSVLAPLVVDEQKHNHRVIEMLLQNELDEMLKAEPSKQELKVSGEKMSVYDVIRAGVIDEQRISIVDVNTLRGFVQ